MEDVSWCRMEQNDQVPTQGVICGDRIVQDVIDVANERKLNTLPRNVLEKGLRLAKLPLFFIDKSIFLNDSFLISTSLSESLHHSV